MAARNSHKQKILIVDDSEMNRSILADMLGEEYSCIEAANGQQAIELMSLYGDKLGLVLLDIVMPVMDGLEVLKIMNERKWIQDHTVHVVALVIRCGGGLRQKWSADTGGDGKGADGNLVLL